MTSLLLALSLAISLPFVQEKPVPDDSVLIETRGCLKGRVFTATPPPETEGVTRGPNVTGRHFRVAGPRQVMDLVKQHDGHLVQVVGIVRKAALDDRGVSMRAGRGRVAIGGGGDPSRMNARTTAPGSDTMDLTSVRFLSESCPVE